MRKFIHENTTPTGTGAGFFKSSGKLAIEKYLSKANETSKTYTKSRFMCYLPEIEKYGLACPSCVAVNIPAATPITLLKKSDIRDKNGFGEHGQFIHSFTCNYQNEDTGALFDCKFIGDSGMTDKDIG